MYTRHFGFTRQPFDGGIARDGDVFLGATQQAALDNLGVALSSAGSAVVLTGPAGIGKTTLACAALRAASTRIALGWLGTVPTDPQDLPELLLAEFGLSAPGPGRVERLQTWRQFLSEMGATESRVLVIVEHAEELAATVLRTLESLTAADPNGCPGANLVLTGAERLATVLDAPSLQALRQRLRLRQTLAPFTPEDTERYLRHRIQMAGGRPDGLLCDATVDALHRYADGVPRVLNNLCETALTLAATRGATALEPALIAHVAEHLFGLALPAADSSGDDDGELPVLTDAVEAATQPDRAVALLHDVRLETRRADLLDDEELSFAAAAAALARLADEEMDELATSTMWHLGRA